MLPTSEWHMVDYDIGNDCNWYGLIAGDGVRRGVPEGTRAQWSEVMDAMRKGEEWSEKRLGYVPGVGISSPRNTNSDADTFQTDDADLIERLLAAPQEWRADGRWCPVRKG